jgi:hypothetical protein
MSSRARRLQPSSYDHVSSAQALRLRCALAPSWACSGCDVSPREMFGLRHSPLGAHPEMPARVLARASSHVGSCPGPPRSALVVDDEAENNCTTHARCEAWYPTNDPLRYIAIDQPSDGSAPNVSKLSCGARPAKRAVRAARLAAVMATKTCAARIVDGRRPSATSGSFNGLLAGAVAIKERRQWVEPARQRTQCH